jgi:microcin C transport system substrate-binding protein
LITFDSLMVAARDEPDSFYGLIAKTADLADDRASITFVIRDEARFHDGSPITAEDVAFSLATLKEKGHPNFRIVLRDISQATVVSSKTVRFEFAEGVELRDLPNIAATMPIFSKAYFSEHDFEKTSLTPPLGNGPYKIGKVDAGRSISYERVEDYWARGLPVSNGRFNFDQIKFIYFRDRDIALEALFAGKLDFREEFTSRSWATQYDKPAVNNGSIVKERVVDARPAGFQAFHLNLRRDKFKNILTRQALTLVFDFDWTNKNLFHSLYSRTYSVFQNSDLEATAEPSAAEIALLEPYRAQISDATFGPAFVPPKTDGSGNIRRNLKTAQELLKKAGWRNVDGKLVDKTGQAFTIEFLSYSKGFERIVAPFVRNLGRLGISANFRLVEPAQYQRRTQEFDFDVITLRWGSSLTPGVGLRNLYQSKSADMVGSNNFAGIKNPVVDALIEKVIAARSRTELQTAARALDRVLMWEQYVIPQWYSGHHHFAYWDKFGRPAKKPNYARGVWDLWWVDDKKAAALAAKRN